MLRNSGPCHVENDCGTLRACSVYSLAVSSLHCDTAASLPGLDSIFVGELEAFLSSRETLLSIVQEARKAKIGRAHV